MVCVYISLWLMPDFYLSYTSLRALSQANPANPMLAGRGPPGTHDVDLLVNVLSAISTRPAVCAATELPTFDKSLHGGYGDRTSDTIQITGPLDVFVLEGWSMGFAPISDVAIEQKQRHSRVAVTHSRTTLEQVNALLGSFALSVYPFFDAHIGIRPQSFDYVYTWRLEQEHHLKMRNGGAGMSDHEVRAFVDRYMPCYELYGYSPPRVPSLILEYGEERQVVSSKTCIH